MGVRNFSLLSFGEEAEGDEELISEASMVRIIRVGVQHLRKVFDCNCIQILDLESVLFHYNFERKCLENVYCCIRNRPEKDISIPLKYYSCALYTVMASLPPKKL